MLKSELRRVFGSVKGRIVIAIIFLFPLIDIATQVYSILFAWGGIDGITEDLYHWGVIEHPTYMAWLSGNGEHFTQILLGWILPVWFLILYSDTYVEDRDSGYLKSLFSRTGKKTYYKTKFQIAFWLPALLMLATILLNLLLCICLFFKGYTFGGWEEDIPGALVYGWKAWMDFSIAHPYPIYLLYTLAYAYGAGLNGIVGLCCSVLFRNKYLAYPVAFFLWFTQLMSPVGSGSAMQPFTEYDLPYFISGLLIFSVIVLVVFLVTYFVRIRRDEL